MNQAIKTTEKTIEATLGSHGSYRKVDDLLYVIKQGSTYVMISVIPWDKNKAVVRVCAQLVRGVRMTVDLATQLLQLNAHLRFGSFGYEPDGATILFCHSMVGGKTLDSEELMATLTDVALVADEYDDKIISKFGGQTMRDLLEEAALSRILAKEPNVILQGAKA